MRKLVTILLVAAFSFGTSGQALERRSVPMVDSAESWNAGVLCTINYSNTCTGWVWVWTGFGDGARLGTVYTSCCGSGTPGGALFTSTVYVMSGPPPGYGYTGSIAVYGVDGNNCPVGAPLALQAFLPGSSAAQLVSWGSVVVPPKWAIVLTLEEPGAPNPTGIVTDHPAAGATGPVACGSCYPQNRLNRSFAYGTPDSPLCPGSTFNDGVCDAQLIWWAELGCACCTSVEYSSWGQIKGLYR